MEYLGYVITREGIKPQAKKVEKMMAMNAPQKKFELRGFVGMINYNRNLWPGRAHMLAPLTNMCEKKKNSNGLQKLKKCSN